MERMNKMKRKILSYILLVVMVLALVGCGDTSEKSTSEGTTNTSGTQNDKTSSSIIDISKYLSIEWEVPYEGYGKPVLKIDEEGLNKLVSTDAIGAFLKEYIKDESMAGYMEEGMDYEDACAKIDEILKDPSSDMYPGFIHFFRIDFRVQPMQQVSNGDIMQVLVRLDDEFEEYFDGDEEALATKLGIKIEKYDLEFEAIGLTEPENVVDLVKPLEKYLVYEGVDGEGTVGIKPEIEDKEEVQIHDLTFKIIEDRYRYKYELYHGDEKLGDISYEYTKSTGLSSGEVYGITVEGVPVEELEALGYIIPFETKAIKVPDLGSYLMSKEQITSDTVAHIETYIKNYINDDFNTCHDVLNIYYVKQNASPDGYEYPPYIMVITENSYVNYAGRNYKAWLLKDVIIRPNEISVGYINENCRDSLLENVKAIVENRSNNEELEFVIIK